MTRQVKVLRTWRRPLQLALLTGLGLITALLGNGAWQWLAWLCLCLPIGAVFSAAWNVSRQT